MARGRSSDTPEDFISVHDRDYLGQRRGWRRRGEALWSHIYGVSETAIIGRVFHNEDSEAAIGIVLQRD